MDINAKDGENRPGAGERGPCCTPVRAAWLALFAGAILWPTELRGQEVPVPPPKFTRGALIRFEGPITPLLERYFYRKLDAAREQGAELIIVEIDSPGGFLDASLNIADRLRQLEWAHTVAFVPREALSGAAIASLGCDEILMAPEARLGDAGPIFQGEDALFRHAPEKIRSDLALRVRTLAESKGRPPALAEAMVDMDLIVYRVRDKTTDEEAFLADHEIAAAADPDNWEKIKEVVESREKHFLEVTGERAVELRLAQANVSTREELSERYQLKERLIVLQPSGVDTAVTILNIPFVTGLLFLIGLIALFVEFSAPGIGLGGLVAGLCFAIFFWSRFLGGTAGWLEVILFATGIIFLAVELFVLPGFGVAGLSGILLMFVSILMASQHFILPSTGRELGITIDSLSAVAGSAIVFFIVALGLSHYFGSIPVLSWLALEPPSARTDDENKSTGEEGSAVDSSHRLGVQKGDSGTAESSLRPAGKVRFGEAYVDVVTDGGFVDQGRQVRVIEIRGNRIVVREIEETA